MRKKLIFIPGWMDRGHFHGPWEDLNIWIKNIHPKNKIDAEYVIGHSMGAIFALLNWKHNKNTKVILVNPVFPRRSLWQWAKRYFRFHWREGLQNRLARMPIFIFLPLGFLKLLKLIRLDTMEIVNEIPSNDLILICGKNDDFFCDQEARDIFKKRGVKVIEIEGTGHNWDQKFNYEIEKIVSEK